MKIMTLNRWSMQVRLLLLAIILGLAACGGSGNRSKPVVSPPPPEAVVQRYEVTLEGRQEVPMVRTNQTATATVTVNSTNMTVRAEMNLSGVTGVAGAHIHAGEVGINGPVAFAFSGPSATGVWAIAETAINQTQHDALLAGKWYINVHTASFPGGELRGQILTSTQTVHLFALAGEQEVPSVRTDAYGEGYLLHDASNGALTLNVWTWGVNGTAAHIHQAEAGINGGVIAPLEASADANGLWRLPSTAQLGSAEVSALGMGNLYVNVHSAAYPGGEIRGQILPNNYALVLFEISPGQEVPRANSPASGLGYATLDTQSGGLRLNAWAMNMAATAAHIHQGGIGENGPVVIGLEANTNHAGLWQTPVNTALDSATQALLLAGGHYVNMHSAAFPGGEIRGQITPGPWKMITFPLSGAQQVPAVDTNAQGDGYAMVNTQSRDLMMVVNTRNLDSASAAHLHVGTAGVNGGVVIGLERNATNPATWRLPAATSLDAATLAEFLDAGHYVNFHSPTYPGGEIRGQVTTADHIMFGLSLSGGQEVPPVETMASGQGAFTLHTRTGSLRGAFTTSNIISTAAHIHEGPAGKNGPVILGLEATQTGYRIPTGTVLPEAQRATMLGGGHYVNVHSLTHPAGEIRGQITK